MASFARVVREVLSVALRRKMPMAFDGPFPHTKQPGPGCRHARFGKPEQCSQCIGASPTIVANPSPVEERRVAHAETNIRDLFGTAERAGAPTNHRNDD
jgi:hypothetical protein